MFVYVLLWTHKHGMIYIILFGFGVDKVSVKSKKKTFIQRILQIFF